MATGATPWPRLRNGASLSPRETIEYRPYGAAARLLNCHDPEVLIEGPAGTGKTMALEMKARMVAERVPGSRILFVRKERSSMTETVLVTWEDKVLGAGHPAMAGPRRSHRESYVFPNGSQIICGGMDKAIKVMSGEYDLVCCFEATGLFEHDFEQLTTRLRNGVWKHQQIVADCNPDGPSHWLNRRAMRKPVGDWPGMTRLRSKHEDNPLLWRDGDWTEVGKRYIAKLDSLTGTRRDRLRLGKWSAAEGVVYDTFLPSTHVQEWHGRRPRRVVVGCDDGYTNPFVALLGFLDGDDRLHIASEVYQSGLLPSQRVDRVRSIADGYSLDCITCDPSAADLIAGLRDAGMPAVGADNSVFDGVCRVQQRFAEAGDGLVRLTIDPSCVNLIAELETYRWRKTRINAPDDSLQDAPMKENDHACDALRYIASYLHESSGELAVCVGVDGAIDRSDWDLELLTGRTGWE